jgi:hypothetical protein
MNGGPPGGSSAGPSGAVVGIAMGDSSQHAVACALIALIAVVVILGIITI